MSLNLRVVIPGNGSVASTTKVMRFTEQMSVHEAIKTVQEKVGFGGKDHALFQPTENDPVALGKWLKPEKTLEFYDLKQNDTIMYKKKSETIKVKLVDDTVKTVMTDLSVSVVDLVDVIGKKVGLKNPGEFSLQEDARNGWLKNQLPLCEQVKSLDQVFVMKKKFFVNDANVSTDDPVELHLVYCQSRDDIVNGNHPCSKDEAVQFGALQAQIANGNLNPGVHGPGFLNLKEYLPPEYRSKDVEKRTLDEWKKLVGMNEVNARFRYVQLCRSLKTYGMTCFKVREKVPGKKKLMDAVLCFTRDSIVRMEYENKRIIKEHSFKHLLRWAASPETFTMDFGAYEEEYIVVVTNEGEPISNLIAGYIDLLLRKQRDTGVVIEDDKDQIADVEAVARVGNLSATSIQSSTTPMNKYPAISQGVNDIYAAASAMEKIKNEMFAGEMSVPENSLLTPEQRKGQVQEHAKALANLTEGFETLAKGGNKNAMNAAALKMVQLSEQLVISARQAAASSNDPNDLMMVETAKGICDALKAVMTTAQEYAKNPNSPQAKEALLRSQQRAQAALQKLGAIARGAVVDDEGFKQLFREMARAVNADANELLGKAKNAENAIQDPVKREQLGSASSDLQAAADQMALISDLLGPTAKDSTCKINLEKAARAVESSSNFVVATAKSSGSDPKVNQQLLEAQKRLGLALQNLMGITELPDLKGADQSDDFAAAAQQILQSAAALMASEGNPELIKQHAVLMKNAVGKLGSAGKQIIASNSDPMARERLANYLKGVVEGAKKVLNTAQSAATNPNDKQEHKKLREATQEVSEATQALLADAGKPVALAALYNSAKLAAAQTAHLITSSRGALNGRLNDPTSNQQLSDAVNAAGLALGKLLSTLKDGVPQELNASKRRTSVLRKGTTSQNASPLAGNTGTADIMQACEQFAPATLKLVSGAKSCAPKVTDSETKQDMIYTSSKTAEALQKMLEHRKNLKGLKTQLETAEAMEAFKGAFSDIEAALISADTGLLKGNVVKDVALKELGEAIEQMNTRSQKVQTTAKNAPEDLGPAMKDFATAFNRVVAASASLASCLEDKSLQKGLLNATKNAAQQMKQLLQVARAVGTNPDDQNLGELLLDAAKAVAEALSKLRDASAGITPAKMESFFKTSSDNIEDLAEKELQGAADVIEKCVAKLQAATQAARERMTAKQVDIDEQNITEAILESCQAIAKSTAVLVAAATAVQQDYNKLVAGPTTKVNAYKRDPTWAQGLVSAARTVAGSVQHLVKAANLAAQGNASEEALIVAAQSVSAATTQLVTASTVKSANVSTGNQTRLNDAAKKVTAATAALVKTAKDAAAWEEEQQKEQDDANYNLTDSKVKEMEQQMAILRLEKELEKARTNLSGMKKAEYTKNVNPEFKQNGTAAAPPPPRPTRDPGQVSQVKWKQNNIK